MRNHKSGARRRGALILECAIVYPLMLTLLLGFVLCGMAVFRSQQVTCQAREAARWACVRGADYHADTNLPSPTRQQIYQTVVLPLAVGMATENLNLTVQWVDQSTGTAYDWDGALKYVKSVTPQGEYVTNTIRVTVTYQVSENAFWQSPLSMSSTSEIPMAY